MKGFSTYLLQMGEGPESCLLSSKSKLWGFVQMPPVLLSRHIVCHSILQFPVGLSLSSARSGISGNHDYTSGMRSYPQGLTVIFGIWHFAGIQKIVLKGSKQV